MLKRNGETKFCCGCGKWQAGTFGKEPGTHRKVCGECLDDDLHRKIEHKSVIANLTPNGWLFDGDRPVLTEDESALIAPGSILSAKQQADIIRKAIERT